MNKTALIYHSDYLKHDAGRYHPERAERLTAVMDRLHESRVMDELMLFTPEPCSIEDLLLAHTQQHVEYIRGLSEQGGGRIDADTYCGAETYEIARLAVGGEILAGKTVAEGKADNAFALVRPPGHHATRNRAMGFCYFNSVAIMIRYLQKNFGIKKICVFDWDVHAANGTEEIFYRDPSVLTISVHQDPLTIFPGTGFLEDLGEGEGRGYNINVPLRPGAGDGDYAYVMEEFVLDKIREYGPDMLVISAGFDSHIADPLGSLDLTEKGYAAMTTSLLETAEEVCGGKLVVEIEGGYELDSLATSVQRVLEVMLGTRKEKIRKKASPSTEETVAELKDRLSRL